MSEPRGIGFPFRFNAAGSVNRVQGVEKLKANISSVVVTALKERLIRKAVGTVGYALVLRNRDSSALSLVETLIQEAIVRFERRVILTSVRVSSEDAAAGNKVLVDVEFVFRETGEPGTMSAQLT